MANYRELLHARNSFPMSSNYKSSMIIQRFFFMGLDKRSLHNSGGTHEKSLPRAKMFHSKCLLVKDILQKRAPGSIPRAVFKALFNISQ